MTYAPLGWLMRWMGTPGMRASVNEPEKTSPVYRIVASPVAPSLSSQFRKIQRISRGAPGE